MTAATINQLLAARIRLHMPHVGDLHVGAGYLLHWWSLWNWWRRCCPTCWRAYPSMIDFLLAFRGYQVDRWPSNRAYSWSWLTVVHAVIEWLKWRE
jgi:hypothetical protein